MKVSHVSICAALALMFLCAYAEAHDEFRVIGTIVQQKQGVIEVKTADGRTANIRLDANTEILQSDTKAKVSELKVGRYVVVTAYGDSYKDMLALDIKIVAAPAN